MKEKQRERESMRNEKKKFITKTTVYQFIQ